jgi:hypothetical protein
MKRLLLLVIFAIPLVATAQRYPTRPPKWYKTPPTAADRYYAVGKGTSASAEVAERKARLDANSKLAEMVEPAVVSVSTRIDSVVRGNVVLEEKVQIMQKRVKATLSGHRLANKSVTFKNDVYTVYILLEMPKRNLSRLIVEQINVDKELLGAISSTKVYRTILEESEEE